MTEKDQPAAAPCPRTCPCRGAGSVSWECPNSTYGIGDCTEHPGSRYHTWPCPWRTTREAEARASTWERTAADTGRLVVRREAEVAALRERLVREMALVLYYEYQVVPVIDLMPRKDVGDFYLKRARAALAGGSNSGTDGKPAPEPVRVPCPGVTLWVTMGGMDGPRISAGHCTGCGNSTPPSPPVGAPDPATDLLEEALRGLLFWAVERPGLKSAPIEILNAENALATWGESRRAGATATPRADPPPGRWMECLACGKTARVPVQPHGAVDARAYSAIADKVGPCSPVPGTVFSMHGWILCPPPAPAAPAASPTGPEMVTCGACGGRGSCGCSGPGVCKLTCRTCGGKGKVPRQPDGDKKKEG